MLQVGMGELPRGNTSESGTFLDTAYDASDRSVVTFPGKIKSALFVAASGVNCNAHLSHVLSLACGSCHVPRRKPRAVVLMSSQGIAPKVSQGLGGNGKRAPILVRGAPLPLDWL